MWEPARKEQLLMETLHHPAELQPTVSSVRWTGVDHRQVQGLARCGKLTPTAFRRLARLRREGSLFPSSGPATCTAATQQESGSLPPRIFSTTLGLQQHRALQDKTVYICFHFCVPSRVYAVHRDHAIDGNCPHWNTYPRAVSPTPVSFLREVKKKEKWVVIRKWSGQVDGLTSAEALCGWKTLCTPRLNHLGAGRCFAHPRQSAPPPSGHLPLGT